jgi:hypothetical protein
LIKEKLDERSRKMEQLSAANKQLEKLQALDQIGMSKKQKERL